MTTYDPMTQIGRVRFSITDTEVDKASFTDAEIQLALDRYEGLADSRKEDWSAAELLTILLTADSRLVGKSEILGVSLDGVSWRDACKDRVLFLRQRHIMGPS